MTPFDSALRAITDQHGVFLRREALQLGLDDRSLAAGIKAGDIHRVRRGAFAMGDTWADADGPAKLIIVTKAVARVCDGPVAASHHSGVAVHGMAMWDVPTDVAHLTRLDGAAGRTDPDAVHHEGLWLPSDLRQRDGLTVMAPERAALESASLLDVERGVAVVDSGLSAGLFTEDTLTTQHQLQASWPGAQHLQVVVRIASPLSKSVGESRCKFVFFRHGLPMPTLQFEVYAHGVLVGTTDFAWPELGLLGEFDGKEKYLKYLRPGESAGDAVFREKRREDLLRRVTGWGMVRFVWADLYYPTRMIHMVRNAARASA